MELELKRGERSSEEKSSSLVNEEGGAESNPVKDGELGLRDLFSKELWLITSVLWLVWPISELSSQHIHLEKVFTKIL